MEDDDIYAIKETTAIHTEQIGHLRDELKRQATDIRSLELKWYGVVAGLVGTVAVIAKMGGWV
jgi:hypothetical protein